MRKFRLGHFGTLKQDDDSNGVPMFRLVSVIYAVSRDCQRNSSKY